jgi:hypothetical protein
MTKYHGGQQVKDGYYWGGFKGELLAIDGPGGVLPGGKQASYWKIPLIAIVPFGLFLGGAYVIFLPFIGFALVIGFVANKLWQEVLSLGYSLTKLAAPGWVPGEAFFARLGRREKKQKGAAKISPPKEEATGKLAALEKEIEKRRKQRGQ